METSSILIEQIIAIFIIVLIGVICYKTKLIDDRTNSKLSNILVNVVTPVLIFTSFQMDFNIELVEGFIISLVLAVVTHIVSIVLSYILIRRKKRRVIVVDGKRTTSYVENEDVEVERLTSSYANMGFLGIPLAYGLFGNEGLFYVTASVMTFNLFVWTHGDVMLSGNRRVILKDIVIRLCSPVIISIFLGIIFFAFQIKLPKVVNQALNYIGSINTPFAMMISGATIAKTDIIKLFTRNLRKYYMVFLKLLLIPFVLMLMYVWLPIDMTVKMVAIIMAATPTAAVSTIITIKHNKNSVLAAEVFALTTLLCVFTIPFIAMIAELIM
jgi:predicted permease